MCSAPSYYCIRMYFLIRSYVRQRKLKKLLKWCCNPYKFLQSWHCHDEDNFESLIKRTKFHNLFHFIFWHWTDDWWMAKSSENFLYSFSLPRISRCFLFGRKCILFFTSMNHRNYVCQAQQYRHLKYSHILSITHIFAD